MAKKTTKISYKGSADDFGIRLDDKKLKFNEKGVATKDLQSGVHFLQYFFRAPPGRKITLEIHSPKESKWKGEKTIPSNSLIIGSKKFTVNKL